MTLALSPPLPRRVTQQPRRGGFPHTADVLTTLMTWEDKRWRRAINRFHSISFHKEREYLRNFFFLCVIFFFFFFNAPNILPTKVLHKYVSTKQTKSCKTVKLQLCKNIPEFQVHKLHRRHLSASRTSDFIERSVLPEAQFSHTGQEELIYTRSDLISGRKP